LLFNPSFDRPAKDVIRKGDRMTNSTSGMNREDLRQAAETAKETARKGIHAAKETLNEGYETARDKLHEGYDYAREQLHHAYDTARERGSEAIDSLESTIREHPLAALAVAAGVGVVIGLMMRSR
jgi:ElaB/YqjD/DUF883 family membrane-anchored ribosome-binding protein